MNAELARRQRASASEELRPMPGTGTPLAPVPLAAVPGWNGRIRRYLEAA